MRIKVTGYIDADGLEEDTPGAVDHGHEMGISDSFYSSFAMGAGLVSSTTGQQAYLEDLEFEKIDD